ncbi:hypothetical protein [Streptomyces sp. NBC_00203]|uniref:hypothetical protein n=1 Tax=Streptomyces sp. NBC_00203 TaxID=2975680 RepID=UPI0032514E0F
MEEAQLAAAFAGRLRELTVAPFLFAGSGMSWRCLGLAGREELLEQQCADFLRPHAYYRATAGADLPGVARLSSGRPGAVVVRCVRRPTSRQGAGGHPVGSQDPPAPPTPGELETPDLVELVSFSPLLDPGMYQLDELREGLAEHMDDRGAGSTHKTGFHLRVCLSDLLKHGPDSAHMGGAG